MKKIWVTTVLMATLLLFNAQTSFAAEYLIAEGDVLSINVLGLQEMQIKEIIVRPDGKIDMPLIGEIQAAGRSPSDLSKTLTDDLKPYVKKPYTAVNIAKFYAIKVYVLGEVRQPGIVQLRNPRNVMGAIAAAGGWTQDAAKTKVYLIRNGQKDPPILINLLAIVRNGDTTQNYALGNGDIIFVDGNNRLDWGRDIAPIIASVYYISNINSGNNNNSKSSSINSTGDGGGSSGNGGCQ